jgi:hypothetical protein
MACTPYGGTGVKGLAVTSSGYNMLLMVDDAWEVLVCLLALLMLIVLAWL